MRDMAPERPNSVDGKLVEAPAVIPGTLREREQKTQPLGQRRNFLSNFVDKLPIIAGTAALIGAISLGSRGGDNQESPDTSAAPRPGVAEGFIPKESAIKIIDANHNPEVVKDITANIGSTLTLTITENSNGHVYPRLRTSPELINVEGAQIYNVVSNEDIQAINGAPIDLQPGSEIKISDYISVPGYDADGGLGGPGGEWLASEATLKDGSKKIIYISLSNQTRPNWDIESNSSSNSLPLSQAIDLPGQQLNKTQVVK